MKIMVRTFYFFVLVVLLNMSVSAEQYISEATFSTTVCSSVGESFSFKDSSGNEQFLCETMAEFTDTGVFLLDTEISVGELCDSSVYSADSRITAYNNAEAVASNTGTPVYLCKKLGIGAGTDLLTDILLVGQGGCPSGYQPAGDSFYDKEGIVISLCKKFASMDGDRSIAGVSGCVDSDSEAKNFLEDNDISIYTKGSITVTLEDGLTKYTLDDKCDRSFLNERFCTTSGFQNVRTFFCANGCENDACINENGQETECWDENDPDNDPFILGTCLSGNGEEKKDTCTNADGEVIQWSCNDIDKICVSYTVECPEFTVCKEGEGVCEYSGDCFDSDANEEFPDGLNYYEKGIIRPTELEDHCDEQIENRLVEYTCEKNEFGNFYRFYVCPDGCEDGACIAGEGGSEMSGAGLGLIGGGLFGGVIGFFVGGPMGAVVGGIIGGILGGLLGWNI